MTTTRALTEQQERDTAREQGLGPLMDALDRGGQKYDVEVVDGTAVVTSSDDEWGVMSLQAQPPSDRYAVRFHSAREWAHAADPLWWPPDRLFTLAEAVVAVGWAS